MPGSETGTIADRKRAILSLIRLPRTYGIGTLLLEVGITVRVADGDELETPERAFRFGFPTHHPNQHGHNRVCAFNLEVV